MPCRRGAARGLQEQIDKLERTQRELRVQLAAAEETRWREGRERAEVARTIGELQAQVAREQQEIEFYRGLVAQPGQQAAVPCGCSSFTSLRCRARRHYALRFILSRAAASGRGRSTARSPSRSTARAMAARPAPIWRR